MAVDPAGNLFLVGLLDAWAVARRNTDGVWQEVEFPFGMETGWVPSGANSIAMDRVGNVYVGGSVRLGGFDDRRRSLIVQKLAAPPTVLPPLQAVRTGDRLLFSWPASVIGVVLEMTDTIRQQQAGPT